MENPVILLQIWNIRLYFLSTVYFSPLAKSDLFIFTVLISIDYKTQHINMIDFFYWKYHFSSYLYVKRNYVKLYSPAQLLLLWFLNSQLDEEHLLNESLSNNEQNER